MLDTLFGMLSGISPWWWVAFALALAAIEVMTFTYFLLWPALAAATIAALLVFSPGMSGTAQLSAFALLTLVYAIVGWFVLKKIRAKAPPLETGLNQRSARLVGRRATVSGSFDSGIGWVTIDGERWRARLDGAADKPAIGGEVSVSGAEGMTLIVSLSD